MAARCVWAVAAAFGVLPHASDAQAYERLKAENDRARAAAASGDGGAAVGGGWGAGGGAAAMEVQPQGGVAKQSKPSTTWTPPTGDPYTVATARFQAAEQLSPFTFLENQPLKCAPAFALASTVSHPSQLFDTASCFDYCADREECGYVYVAERRPLFCEVYTRCNRMHLVPSDGGVRGSIYSLAMRGVAEEIDGLWLVASDEEAEAGWLPDDGSDPVLQELLVRRARACARARGRAPVVIGSSLQLLMPAYRLLRCVCAHVYVRMKCVSTCVTLCPVCACMPGGGRRHVRGFVLSGLRLQRVHDDFGLADVS